MATKDQVLSTFESINLSRVDLEVLKKEASKICADYKTKIEKILQSSSFFMQRNLQVQNDSQFDLLNFFSEIGASITLLDSLDKIFRVSTGNTARHQVVDSWGSVLAIRLGLACLVSDACSEDKSDWDISAFLPRCYALAKEVNVVSSNFAVVLTAKWSWASISNLLDMIREHNINSRASSLVSPQLAYLASLS